MCRKLICLISFVLVLGATGNASAELVAYWTFDEGSGTTVYDSSGSGHDGTFEGDPEWADGKLGGALQLDGSGDYVSCGLIDIDTTLTGGLTVCAWINKEPGGDMKFCSNRQGNNAAGGGFTCTIYNNRMEMDFTNATARNLNRDTDGPTVPANIWVHVAWVYDDVANTFNEYHDGVLADSSTENVSVGISTQEFRIGVDAPSLGRYVNGLLDDLRIYDYALSEQELMGVMQGGGVSYPFASRPSPADGTLHADTWVSLSWRPGDSAVSHDVYLGDNFDDVNDGLGDTFRGNQALDSLYFVAGFIGYAYPDGLVNGTTYYWRIDEVNEADPNSPWKGDVWSFTIPSNKAYEPIPANGAKFIDSEVTLSWTAGFGAKVHYVYFGEDYDTVANATDGTLQVFAEYSPGSLELEKTYYWRVDESDGVNAYTGDVWSFTTAKEGGGLRAEYYHWTGDYPPPEPFQVFVTSEMVPEINWNWGNPGSPHALVNVDDFACRFTGEVEAVFTETYTFHVTTDDGQRLWVDGQPIIDMWVQQGMTEHRGTIDLVAGQMYSIELWMYERGGGAGCEMRWSSPSTPKQIVPQAALSPPVRAMGPSPTNGATGTKMMPILKWGAGDFAASHEVYFGTDANAVANADKSSPEYKGTKALGDESYDPGKLAWATSYFWRIDEVNAINPDSPWVGNLWSFTTGDFLVIDDFEDYDAGENQIWYSWIDGLGFGAPGTDPYHPGNGTGAAVGDETSPSYTEETIVHSGSQSMPLAYDNNKQGYSKYSEAELTLTAPRDWTEENVAELSLWFRGYPASTGSFVEGPVGTYTMTGSGRDIWDEADEFHFAYKMLTGTGTIVAKVESVQNTNVWAKAGVMIRETLDAGSKFAAVYITPTNDDGTATNGCRFQARMDTDAGADSDSSVVTAEQTAITAPYWVKLERDVAGNFSGYYSSNGSTWISMVWNSLNIPMTSNVYVGLALTSHDAALTCEAVFSNVTITGTVGPLWANQDIGIESNAAEPLYVAVSNTAGTPAVVVHDDPAAATIDTWTEWVIPLQAFADQGIDLINVDRIAIGLGTKGNMTIPGGSGKMFFDDIRLYRSREAAGE